MEEEKKEEDDEEEEEEEEEDLCWPCDGKGYLSGVSSSSSLFFLSALLSLLSPFFLFLTFRGMGHLTPLQLGLNTAMIL